MKQKGLRKLLSMILAVVMMFSMSATVFADDSNTPYTITINNSTDGYTYIAYQIFVGDLKEETTTDSGGKTNTIKTLSNIKFGSALSATDQSTVLTNYNVASAAALAEAIAAGTIVAEDFASYIADNFTLTAAGTSSYASNYTISVTGAGYYLIKNTNVPSGNYAYSNYILEVVSNVTTNPKDNSVPEFDKEVTISTTDSDKESTADYDIGDNVPFTLTATLPSSYSEYTTYKLVFHDTLSDGLTFNNDVKVVAKSTNLTANTDYTVESTVDSSTGETTVTITITNLKTVAGLQSGDTVVVTYTAELNNKAETTENNRAYLEYSNNPNGDETGMTNTDDTYVVTLTLEVNKTDGTNPLIGAGFTLYKKNETSSNYDSVKEIAADNTTTKFTFSGLAIGSYKLSETTTPSGYNTAEDIYFVIGATTSENENTGEVTTEVTIKDASGNVISTGSEPTFSVTTTTISTTVVNNAGTTLPSTGGIGTTIFYIIGGVLVIGAAVLLVTKKRLGDVK